MSKYDKLPNSPPVDGAIAEQIMRNARTEPMELIYIGDDDSLAFGNTKRGFRYYDAEGNRLPREDAEPIRLTGTNIVIRRSFFEVEVPEVSSEDQPQ